jgi:tetratricopeptide (TPR) repeat protein
LEVIVPAPRRRSWSFIIAILMVTAFASAQEQKLRPADRKATAAAAALAQPTATPEPTPEAAPAPSARSVADAALSELAAWQNQAARSILEQAKPTFGNTPEFATAWALLEIQEGASGNAEMVSRGTASLAKSAAAPAGDPAALYQQGELKYQQKKNSEAAAAWQAASKRASELVAENPQNASAQFYLGAALVRLKSYEPAMTALQRAEAGGFDPAMVSHQIGNAYLFQQRWQEAKDAFDRGLAADPRYAPMYFWRAMAWEKLGRKDNMLLDLDQYLKLAPTGPEAGKARTLLKSAGG